MAYSIRIISILILRVLSFCVVVTCPGILLLKIGELEWSTRFLWL